MTYNCKDIPQLSEAELITRYDAEATVCPTRYCRSKRWLDLALAVVLAIPILAVVVMLVWLVRRTSMGPGIFRQKRVGLHGRVFTIYKIRSMYMDAEQQLGPTWAAVDDPRVTPIGYWLRKLHLDELPQIINVLKGDMSFVGPRPERPEFVSLLCNDIDGYMNRLAVRPGVTGLAQIVLPPDSGWESARSKQLLDIEYIQHGNLLLDVRMLSATALRILGVKGEWAIKLLRLRHISSIDGVELVKPSCAPTSVRELAGSQQVSESEDVAQFPNVQEPYSKNMEAAPTIEVEAITE